MSINIVPAHSVSRTAEGKLTVKEQVVARCRATQTTPDTSLLTDPNEPLALDIEFQEYRHKDAVKWGHRMGRIAIVNTRGKTIYDTYVNYERDEDVSMKMPPAYFGVTWKDLNIANGARPSWEVENKLRDIMTGRTIVGHGMRLDIGAMSSHLWDDVTVVDTQGMYGQVALSRLADEILDLPIQNGFHHPTEDAIATMLLYLRRHPYKNRTSFKDPEKPLNLADEGEYPSLGAAVGKKKKR
ncbi:REX4, RNA exonuclease 4 [Vermiconidia calcicola]|uniref:REX4, RNA exonuclease 4 n=1 Tax=Vermiconidia calcicola TaxID=1690605 RepID=A0ACC3N0I9_9PEZI|nr:REX4, RNA exonuclease 4 [Vermiconidia calcicola]